MTTPAKYPTRQFLLIHPRPAKVRLVLANGEARELVMGSSPIWKRIAETIDALAPQTVEALDASGALLRARNPALAIEQEELAEGDPDEDPTTPLQDDGSLETFARLLADAHRASGERSFQFVETAFARMVEIVNAQTRRMDSMERVVEGIHRTWRRAYEASLDAPEEGDGKESTLQQMLSSFLAAKAQGAVQGAVQSAVAPNGTAPNGHAKKGA